MTRTLIVALGIAYVLGAGAASPIDRPLGSRSAGTRRLALRRRQ